MSETPLAQAVAQLASEFMDYLDEHAEPDEEVESAIVAVVTEEGIFWQVRTAEGTDGSSAEALQLALELAQAAAEELEEAF